MYAVVGCNECAAMWLLRDARDSETAGCPRCGKTHQTSKLRRFYESPNRAEAQEARAALLAEKHGNRDAFDAVDHVADLERVVESAGIDDREYLEAAGIDPEPVMDAGSRTGRGSGTDGSSRSRPEILQDAVENVEEPVRDEIIAYAVEHGVPADAARSLLETLTRRGKLSETQGRYRVV